MQVDFLCTYRYPTIIETEPDFFNVFGQATFRKIWIISQELSQDHLMEFNCIKNGQK